MRALVLSLAVVALCLACGPSVDDIPSCDGVDTSDLTCDNAKEKYENAETGAEQQCYQDYWSACAEAGLITE